MRYKKKTKATGLPQYMAAPQYIEGKWKQPAGKKVLEPFKIDELVTTRKRLYFVIPVKTGANHLL
jgi:hypothetical protein